MQIFKDVNFHRPADNNVVSYFKSFKPKYVEIKVYFTYFVEFKEMNKLYN